MRPSILRGLSDLAAVCWTDRLAQGIISVQRDHAGATMTDRNANLSRSSPAPELRDSQSAGPAIRVSGR
jgi:hypothetical protein